MSEKITTEQALRVREALITLCDFLDMPFIQVAGNVCLLDKKMMDRLTGASAIWTKFIKADVVERGKMLGIEVTVSDA